MEYKTEEELLQESFEQDYKDMDNLMKSLFIGLTICGLIIACAVYGIYLIFVAL